MSHNETIELTDHIDHAGTVVGTDPGANTVRVRIDAGAECGSCPATALCRRDTGEGNTVTVETVHAGRYRKGDAVTVRGTERMHRKAVMYATVLPSIALVAVMVGVYLLTANQLAAALSGLGAMILFFTAMWLARNKVAHEFTFTILPAGGDGQTR